MPSGEGALVAGRGARMVDCGLDADSVTRWVLRKEYRLRRPTPEQISQYRYWHHVSRTRGFAAAGPWQDWPHREIPPAPPPARATHHEASRADAPAEAENSAMRLLQRRLAVGNWPRSRLEDETRAAGIAVEALDAAASRLGVVTLEGRWALR